MRGHLNPVPGTIAPKKNDEEELSSLSATEQSFMTGADMQSTTSFTKSLPGGALFHFSGLHLQPPKGTPTSRPVIMAVREPTGEWEARRHPPLKKPAAIKKTVLNRLVFIGNQTQGRCIFLRKDPKLLHVMVCVMVCWGHRVECSKNLRQKPLAWHRQTF